VWSTDCGRLRLVVRAQASGQRRRTEMPAPRYARSEFRVVIHPSSYVIPGYDIHKSLHLRPRRRREELAPLFVKPRVGRCCSFMCSVSFSCAAGSLCTRQARGADCSSAAALLTCDCCAAPDMWGSMCALAKRQRKIRRIETASIHTIRCIPDPRR
jgi:hypothetical protein